MCIPVSRERRPLTGIQVKGTFGEINPFAKVINGQRYGLVCCYYLMLILSQ